MKHKPIIPKNHPRDDRSGWYSTFQVMEIFNWKRGLIKNWIEGGYISGAGFSDDRRGRLVFFAGFQLYTLRLFKYLLEIGLSRGQASSWSKRLESDIVKKGHLEVENITFIVFELENGQVQQVYFFKDQEEIRIDYIDDSNDFLVVNFNRLIEEVDAIS